MRVELRQLGSLQKEAENARVDFATALWLATNDATLSLQRLQRQDLERTGIKRATAMAKTWRSVVKPRNIKDLAPGQSPQGFVFNRSRVFAVYFAKGGVARGRGGRALPIPVGRARNLKLPIGRPRTQLIAAAKAKFGELTLITMKDGRQALGLVKRSAKGKERFEALFVFVREARVPRLVTPVPIFLRFTRRLQPRWTQIVASRFEGLSRGRRGDTQIETNQDRKQADRLDGFTIAGASRGLSL